MSYSMIKLSVPAAQQDAMNRLSVIIDPDTSGGDFVVNASLSGSSPATHCLGSAPVTPQTKALIQSKDPDMWYSALYQMAQERGREPPINQDCIDVCASIALDSDVSVIQIEQEQ